MAYVIIDRFEGGFVVCEQEDGSRLDLFHDVIPAAAREGDVLRLAEDGNWHLDPESTRARRERVQAKLNNLFAG